MLTDPLMLLILATGTIVLGAWVSARRHGKR
jgi:hypothetical protein